MKLEDETNITQESRNLEHRKVNVDGVLIICTELFTAHCVVSNASIVNLRISEGGRTADTRAPSRSHGDLSFRCGWTRPVTCMCNVHTSGSTGAHAMKTRLQALGLVAAQGHRRDVGSTRLFTACFACFLLLLLSTWPDKIPYFPFSLPRLCLGVVTESRGPVHHRKPSRTLCLCFRYHDTTAPTSD